MRITMRQRLSNFPSSQVLHTITTLIYSDTRISFVKVHNISRRVTVGLANICRFYSFNLMEFNQK